MSAPAPPHRHRTVIDRPHAEPALRMHSLDVLRVGAMLLVLALHACLSYTTLRVPHLLWPLSDPPGWIGFDYFLWWSLGTSMPIFFTLSGLFTARAYHDRGLRHVAGERIRRIFLPTFAGIATILPITLWIWSYGWFVSGRCEGYQFLPRIFYDPQIKPNIIGPGHLWFLTHLTDLLALSFVVVLIRGPRPPIGSHPAWERILRSPWRPVLLAIPTAIIAWYCHRRLTLDPVMAMHNAAFPPPERLIHHAWFFVVGIAMAPLCRREGIAWLIPHSGIYLAASVPVFIVRAWCLQKDMVETIRGWEAVASAASLALFGWLIFFGLIGQTQRHLRRESRAVRYLSDSSYWVYLVHFPIVGLLQVNLYRLPFPLPPWAKFSLTLAISLVLSLASYQVFVRYTWIGRWLHGKRARIPALPHRALGETRPSGPRVLQERSVQAPGT